MATKTKGEMKFEADQLFKSACDHMKTAKESNALLRRASKAYVAAGYPDLAKWCLREVTKA